MRRRLTNWLVGRRRRPPRTVECARCQRQLRQRHRGHRFCSGACRQAHWRRVPASKRELRRLLHHDLRAAGIAASSRAPTSFPPRLCALWQAHAHAARRTTLPPGMRPVSHRGAGTSLVGGQRLIGSDQPSAKLRPWLRLGASLPLTTGWRPAYGLSLSSTSLPLPGCCRHQVAIGFEPQLDPAPDLLGLGHAVPVLDRLKPGAEIRVEVEVDLVAHGSIICICPGSECLPDWPVLGPRVAGSDRHLT